MSETGITRSEDSVREEERYADRPRRCSMCTGQHEIKKYSTTLQRHADRVCEEVQLKKKLFFVSGLWIPIPPLFSPRPSWTSKTAARHRRNQRSSPDRQLYRDSSRDTNATFSGFHREELQLKTWDVRRLIDDRHAITWKFRIEFELCGFRWRSPVLRISL